MTAPPLLKLIHFFAAGLSGDVAGEDILGGKGHSLAAMSKTGLPVPPGFTISTACCGAYFAGKRDSPVPPRLPAGLEDELAQALAWLEALTGSRFGAAPKPLFVAVRSGAAVSMPGMMDSVLNVGLSPELESCFASRDVFWTTYRDFVRHYGETVSGVPGNAFDGALVTGPASPQDQARAFLAAYRSATGRDLPTDPATMLRESVVAVFESWNSERAVRYRARNNVRGLAGTAVNVQAMFPSQHAGVLFTADPNNPAAQRMIIEAAPGLGEAIVLGKVEPDVFIVERPSLAMVEKRRPSEPRASASGAGLTDAQVAELARLGLRIEEYFGYPVDVEWGLSDGRFALLQSRRIRGLDVALDVPLARQDEIDRLKKRAAGRPRAVWVAHNLGETLAFPTPLTWDIIGGFMSRGFISLYTDLGFVPSANVRRDGLLVLVAGRIYADAERAAELFFGEFPLTYDLDHVTPDQLLGPPKTFDYERAGAAFLLKLPYHAWTMLRAGRTLRRAAGTCLDDFEKKKLPAFLDYVQRARAKDLAGLSEAQLLAELDERERVALNDFGRETLKPGFLANYYHSRLVASLELIVGPEEGMALANRLTGGLDGDKTVESNLALYRVARGEHTLEQFLKDFGHRAVNEFELSERRWREDSSYLLRTIEGYKRRDGVADKDGGCLAPAALHERQKAERKAAEARLSGLLQEKGASSLEEELRADLAGAQACLPYRETGKHYFMMAVALVRDVLEQLAERYDLGLDLYFLHRDELAAFPSRRDELRKQIAARRVRWQARQRLPVPDVLSSHDLDALGRDEEAPAATDKAFTGNGVAAGTGTGTARVVYSPHDAADLGAGYVLVCPSTDPGWAPLFVHARGLIVERGGMLSHGAIVARDFGIPAVVLKNACRLIPSGATVKVDGSHGRVEIVSDVAQFAKLRYRGG
ncbi:MAG: PEP-utilizing enzyme [Planctomycetota bacterium]|nr:PEP-utilizing enzyme [Planctomycetota bacterium]